MSEEVFSTREDLVRVYSESRKNFPEDEVEDLFNCMMGYLKTLTKDKETYAIKLGKLGFMHKRYKDEFHTEYEPQSKHTIVDKMIVDLSFRENRNTYNPLTRATRLEVEYGDMKINEIEEIQNDI
jgi:hypothetical protein